MYVYIIYVCVHSYIYMYIRVYIHTYTHTYAHTHTHTHAHTHTHTHIFTYKHKNTPICNCIYTLKIFFTDVNMCVLVRA